MKKILVSLMVLALCVPAMAAVTATSDNSVAGEVTVYLTSDSDGIVGVALTVDTAGSATGVVVAESFFDVFVDSAFTAGAGYVYQTGIPTATQGAAGELDISGGSASFSISVAGLDDDGIGAGTDEAPTTCTITITGTAGATVDIDIDALRGGVVGYNGALAVSGLPINTTFGELSECVSSTAPFYADWVAFGKPDCWCYEYQCRGDANGTKEGSTFGGYRWVFNADLAMFLAAYGVLEPTKGPGILSITDGICSDFNHAQEGSAFGGYRRVFNADLAIFLANYGILDPTKGPGLTSCAGPDYNFFIVP